MRAIDLSSDTLCLILKANANLRYVYIEEIRINKTFHLPNTSNTNPSLEQISLVYKKSEKEGQRDHILELIKLHTNLIVIMKPSGFAIKSQLKDTEFIENGKISKYDESCDHALSHAPQRWREGRKSMRKFF